MPIWLGVDIGTARVKVAAVRSAYRRTSLDALVMVDVVRDTDGVEIGSAVRSAVEAVLSLTGTPDAVAVAVDGMRATVRTVALPAGAIKQVAEVLPFELESQIPFEMSESVCDYRFLPRRVGEPGNEATVVPLLVGVARTEDVRKRIDVAREASGVEPERVGLGALPLANLMAIAPSPLADQTEVSETAPVLVIDLGARSSDVLVLVGGEPVFARTLSQGTERIEATANLLAREIRLTIGAFRSLGGAPPVRAYLCGGGSFRSGAHAFLARELDLPCETMPSLTLEMGPSITPERMSELPWFAKALGLALSLGPRPLDLDLRKGPLAFERGFDWVRDKIPVLAGLAMVVLVSFFFSAWAQMHATSLDHETLEGALAIVTKDVLGEETTSAARANELVVQQTTLNDDDPLPHADAFDVMVKLAEDIPATMTNDIDQLDVQKGHVSVHGVVGTVVEAQAISDALAKEHCFVDLKPAHTTKMFGGDRQRYVLEFEEKCPEDVRGGKKKSTTSAAAPTTSGGK